VRNNAYTLPSTTRQALPPTTRQGRILDFAGLWIFVLLSIAPVVFSIIFALVYALGLYGFSGTGLSFEYFTRIWSENEILPSFFLSFYVAGVGTVLTVGLGLFIALYLGQAIRRGALSILIYLPLILPSAVGALFIYLLLANAGVVARILFNVGIINEMQTFPAMVNDPWAIGIILAHLGLGAPFFAILFAQLYDHEKLDEINNLSSSLGASKWQSLRQAVLPLLLWRARPQIILSFIFVFGSFEIPAILGRHAPEMLSVLAVRKLGLFDVGQRPEAYVVAFIYCMLVLTILTVFFRLRARK
jgi:putative spermidine/putrescine transport system permease protein